MTVELATIVSTLLPIFAVIILGYVLRRINFPDSSFWQPAESMTYYVLFPALLVQKIATASDVSSTFLPMVGALVSAVLLMSLLLLMNRRWLAADGQAFTSIFQGTIRFNTYIGLSIILPLFGPPGILLAAVVMAILIPLVNLLSIVILSRFGNNSSAGGPQVLAALARNPVVLACIIGIILNFSNVSLHPAADNLLNILGRASLPLGLLTVGAGLDIAAAKAAGRQIFAATFLKLLLMPTVMWFFCLVFAVDTSAKTIAILFAALPGSALSFILARQLGGDSKLMAGIVTVQTCFSVATLPVILALAMAL